MKNAILIVAFLGFSAIEAQQYVISTYAGGAPPATPIAGEQASIGSPLGVTADSAGNVYFSSLHGVFKLDTNGVLTRLAGNSRQGYSGDGGTATDAQLSEPRGLAVDANGNLYVADTGNNRIRKVSTTGIISTVAGNGSQGYSGDEGPAINARLYSPYGVAVDAGGNLYIADFWNERIRKVSPAGTITTIAGDGTSGFSGDGGQATKAQIQGPFGVAVDAGGNLYIADYWNERIRMVSSAGIITTVAGNGYSGRPADGSQATDYILHEPFGVAVDVNGGFYIAGAHSIRKVSAAGIVTTLAGSENWAGDSLGDGGPAAWAVLSSPFGVAADANGNLLIADSGNYRIRKVTPASGMITTIAGTGLYSDSGDRGPATGAQLFDPVGITVDASGNLYIADSYNARVRKIGATGVITTVAGTGAWGYSGDGGPAAAATLHGPEGVAVDASGTLYIADTVNRVIRRVAADGIITTIAGNGSPGYSGDGGQATSAQLLFPSGVAVDSDHNLYIADVNRIRKVSASGVITTFTGNGTAGYAGDGGQAIAAQISSARGVALDSAGNVYISDAGNNRIRKVSTSGIITTVAGNGSRAYSGDGGPATAASLADPGGVAVDAGGNIYFPDGLGRIRKVSATGVIATVAGNAHSGYSGDGGPALSATLGLAVGVAVDAGGKAYIADASNNAIRLLTPSASGCAYGLSSTSVNAPVAGGTFPVSITSDDGCAWEISSLPDWISVSGFLASGSGPATITLVVVPNSGPPRHEQILVAGLPLTVQQASSVTGINAGGVVNAASYTAPVAPGSITAIFGNFLLPTPIPVTEFPLPVSLGGLSFQFSGAPLAPLFYANSGQVNAQVPWELAGLAQTTITVGKEGQASAPQTVQLATYAPGIFAVNGQGTGQGAIQDFHYQLEDVTNPATAGDSLATIYCTGLGPVKNHPATGEAYSQSETTTRPKVVIGGMPVARIYFSGLAPLYVGLYQINAVVPPGAARGRAVPVELWIGGVRSNTVTIPVQEYKH